MYNWEIKELGIEFKTPSDWGEITITKFAEYQHLVQEMQKDFVDKFNLKDETEINTVTDIEIFTIYPNYFLKLICFWSGLTHAQAYHINKTDFLSCYKYMNHLLAVNTKERGIDRFVFDGVDYLFPRSLTDINGNVALMGGETFGAMIYTFQQEQNLKELGKGRFDVIANQMAITCRPDGEKFNDDISKERAIEFKYLTMDIVWEWVFFSIRHSNLFKSNTRIYSPEEAAKGTDTPVN